MVSSEPQSTGRDTEICLAIIAGETLQVVGDRYGLTRERIRQIALSHNVVSTYVERHRKKPSTCPVCGDEYTSYAQTCSAKCGGVIASHQTRDPTKKWSRHAPPLILTCDHCGQPFQRTKQLHNIIKYYGKCSHTYCGQACYHRSMGRKFPSKPTELICTGCGEAFEKRYPPKITKHPFCSRRCFRKNARKWVIAASQTNSEPIK